VALTQAGAALADVRPRIEFQEFRPGGDASSSSSSSSSSSASSSGKKDDEAPNSRAGGNSGSASDAETVYAYIGMQDVVQEEGTQVTVEVLNADNIMYLDPSRWFPSSQDPAVHYYMSPVYAASRVFVAGALDTLLAQAYYQPQVLQVLQAFIMCSVSGLEDESQSHLVPLPFKFIGHKYQEVFLQTLAQGGMCLGLYRAAGTNGSELPYVVTNPPKTMRMLASDWVIVLCKKDAKCMRQTSLRTTSASAAK